MEYCNPGDFFRSATDMDDTIKCAPTMKIRSSTSAKPARPQQVTRSVNKTMMAPNR